MLAEYYRFIRFIVPAIVFAVTLYFLLFGNGHYEVLYEIIIVAIALFALVFVSILVFTGKRFRNKEKPYRRSGRTGLTKVGLAVGLLLLFLAAPIWLFFSTNWQQSSELIFVPFVGLAILGAILIIYSFYRWLFGR